MIDVEGRQMPIPDPRHVVGLRERKKARTRATLQAVARRLVSEQGFENVTAEQIAAEAEVSKTTLFNYFDSKEAVLVDVSPESLVRMAALLQARPRDEHPLRAVGAAQAAGLTGNGAAALIELHNLTQLAVGHPALQLRLEHRYAAFNDVVMAWVRDRYPTSHPDYVVYPALVAEAGAVAAKLTLQHWDPESGIEQAVQILHTIYARYGDRLTPPPQ